MNHKRRRPKHQRAGCLMCKPWKDERGTMGDDPEKASIRRKLLSMDEQVQNHEQERMDAEMCDGECDYCRGLLEGT